MLAHDGGGAVIFAKINELGGEIPDGKTQLAILKTKAYIEKEGKTL